MKLCYLQIQLFSLLALQLLNKLTCPVYYKHLEKIWIILGIVKIELKMLILSSTLKCLCIWTPKTINFPFVPNEKLMVCRCPNI